jgi:hypothetical protein
MIRVPMLMLPVCPIPRRRTSRMIISKNWIATRMAK